MSGTPRTRAAAQSPRAQGGQAPVPGQPESNIQNRRERGIEHQQPRGAGYRTGRLETSGGSRGPSYVSPTLAMPTDHRGIPQPVAPCRALEDGGCRCPPAVMLRKVPAMITVPVRGTFGPTRMWLQRRSWTHRYEHIETNPHKRQGGTMATTTDTQSTAPQRGGPAFSSGRTEATRLMAAPNPTGCLGSHRQILMVR